MNITWISCYYNIYNDNNFNHMLQKNIKNILDQNLNMIIYTDSSFYSFLSEYIEEKKIKNIRLIILELSEMVIYQNIMNSHIDLPHNRNQTKDTKAYMALMNSKIEFLRRSIDICQDSLFLGWIDLGISKIFKNYENTFLKLKTLNIKETMKTILTPSPYKIDVHLDILCSQIFWLFCGGFFICNRNYIPLFYDMSWNAINVFIEKGFIVWEVNIWAYIYMLNKDVFVCYSGNHNDSILNVPDIFLIKTEEENTKEEEILKKKELIPCKLRDKQFQDAYNFLKQIYDERNRYPILDEYMFIACYYLNKFDEGRIALNRVLFSNMDKIAKINAMRSDVFYTQKIKSSEIIRNVSPFEEPSNIFNASSPSIFIKDQIIYFNIRAVNYSISNTGTYSIRHPQNYLETKNFLCIVDNWKDVCKNNIYKEIFTSNELLNPKFPMHVKGLEDMRIFHVDGDKLYTFATCCECKPYFLPRIVFACYNIKENKEVFIKELSMPDISIICEKNWLPFVDGEDFKFIYSLNPLRIYSIDKDDFKISLIKHKEQNNYYDMRGSAPPISYQNGWLFTVHQIEDSLPRKYYHRLVWYDKNFENVKFSDLFHFDKIGIEFNLGIAISGDHLLFSYSVNDGSSNLLSVSLKEINHMLNFSADLRI